MMMKRSLPKFRSFVGPISLKLESRKFMADYSMRRQDETPMPRSLINVLNMVPKELQGQVYRWLMTEGMRKAAVARRDFVNKYNNKLGTNFSQTDIFSPHAAEANPELAKLKDQIAKDWFDHGFEPRYIPVGDRRKEGEGVRAIDLYQINAHLEDMGKEPFHYGGDHGILQYLNQGSWAKDQFNADSKYDAQGHDTQLNPSDTGLYDTLRTDLESKMDQAKARGDYNAALKIKNQLDTGMSVKKIQSDIGEIDDELEKADGSDELYIANLEKQKKYLNDTLDELLNSRLVKLGLGAHGGYASSSKLRNFYNPIKASAFSTQQLLQKTLKDLENGITFDDASPEEQRIIQDLYKNGMTTRDEMADSLSKRLLGHSNRADVPNELHNPDQTDLLHAKAAIKAYMLSLLDLPPKQGSIENCISLMPVNDMPDPRLTISKNIDGKPVAKELVVTPQLYQDRDALAEKLADTIFDPSTGLFSGTQIYVNRKAKRANGGQWRANARVSSMLSSVASTTLDKELTKHQDISVNFNGQRVSVPVQDLYDTLKDKTVQRVGIKNRMIDPSMEHEKREIPQEELNNYKIKRNDNNTFSLMSPATGHMKKAVRENGKFYELVPKQDKPIPNGYTNAKEVGKGGNYARFEYPDGRNILARRGVDHQTGQDVWYQVPDAQEQLNTDPLINPVSLMVNSGTRDMRHIQVPGDPITTRAAQDKIAVRGGKLGAGLSKDQKDYAGARMEVLMRMSDPEFTYGDLGRKEDSNRKEIPRRHDIYEFLGEIGLDDTQKQHVVNFAKNVLFRSVNPKASQRKFEEMPMTDAQGNESPLFAGDPSSGKPCYLRADVLKAFLKNGDDWQRRVEGGHATNQARKDKSNAISGQGGDRDEDDPQFTDVEDKKSKRKRKEEDDFDIDDIEAMHNPMGIDDTKAQRAIDLDSDDTGNQSNTEPAFRAFGTRDKTVFGGDSIKDPEHREIPLNIGRARTPLMQRPQQTTHQNFTQQQPKPVEKPPVLGVPNFGLGLPKFESVEWTSKSVSLRGYKQWLSEMAGTGAIYDPKVKLKDGCGFNWWGAAGAPGGVSISGDADTSKVDPTGKGSHGKSKPRRK